MALDSSAVGSEVPSSKGNSFDGTRKRGRAADIINIADGALAAGQESSAMEKLKSKVKKQRAKIKKQKQTVEQKDQIICNLRSSVENFLQEEQQRLHQSPLSILSSTNRSVSDPSSSPKVPAESEIEVYKRRYPLARIQKMISESSGSNLGKKTYEFLSSSLSKPALSRVPLAYLEHLRDLAMIDFSGDTTLSCGYTALGRAVLDHKKELIQFFLNGGADVNLVMPGGSHEGFTVLVLAIIHTYDKDLVNKQTFAKTQKEIVELLLNNGARINYRVLFENTALSLACTFKNDDLIELLEQAQQRECHQATFFVQVDNFKNLTSSKSEHDNTEVEAPSILLDGVRDINNAESADRFLLDDDQFGIRQEIQSPFCGIATKKEPIDKE